MSNGDLISRSSLMQVLEGKLYENQLQMPCDWFNFIRRMPAVDAEPVKHGRWQVEWISKLDTHTGEYWEEMYYRCDACDHVCDVDYPYCPHCGAKMDQEDDDE